VKTAPAPLPVPPPVCADCKSPLDLSGRCPRLPRAPRFFRRLRRNCGHRQLRPVLTATEYFEWR